MAARSRDSVARSRSSDSTFTYAEFLQRFPDNGACLDYLRDQFYPAGTECPGCERESKFHRIKGRSAYSCQWCGHQVYPTAGTIFHKTTVSLQLWFYAIYLMASTRCGISAKQLEREIGVSNKTALRMFRQIRTLLSDEDSDGTFGAGGGAVEVDEMYVGGKRRGPGKHPKPGRPSADSHKTPVFGVVERGGRVKATVIPNAKTATLMPLVKKYVLPEATVYSDEWTPYRNLPKMGYKHSRVQHREQIYVMGDVHVQTIEGFWSLVKNGIRGVYHSVSRQHLQSYLDEYAWRYNHRDDPRPMFWAILDQVPQKRLLGA